MLLEVGAIVLGAIVVILSILRLRRLAFIDNDVHKVLNLLAVQEELMHEMQVYLREPHLKRLIKECLAEVDKKRKPGRPKKKSPQQRLLVVKD